MLDLAPHDIPESYGIHKTSDEVYSGKFTISFFSKEELILLQQFFGVRRQKFDMRLLEKRPELLEKLKT
jgi:hypothetical protein